jgi:ABC-type polysaccharide/polyol phosphate transport system ATPase subunit
VVVEVSHLFKRYARDLDRSLRYAVADIARELRLARPVPPGSLRRGEFAALDDVSFSLRRGEALGIVGANGAGKSTLLKLLAGIVKPDGGEIRVRGRLAALIELGTGFDPVLTGRENIAASAAMLGIGGLQLRAITARVIEFAELEDVIDTPVRYYSSGMAARLAFSVAAHAEPDVLLVDEVLAVGDAAFQRRCFAHMLGYLENGGTLVFVSHNVPAVQALCRRGLLLEDGRCTFQGAIVDTVTRYFAVQHALSPADGHDRPRPEPDERDPVVIDRLRVGAAGEDVLRTGGTMRVTLACRARTPVDVLWGFSVWTADGWTCVTGSCDTQARRLAAGATELTCTVADLPLLAGRYGVRGFVVDSATQRPLARVGFEDAPEPLVVEGSARWIDNGLASIGQLVMVDVDWT